MPERIDQKRLWDHILMWVYGTTDMSQVKRNYDDLEGHAFFEAVDAAFTSCGNKNGIVPVHQLLVQYMAGWGRHTSEGIKEKGGPFLPNSNHFLGRAFEGFAYTLREGIRINQLRYFEDGRIMFGCFPIPQWFIDACLDRAYEDALHLNSMWDEHESYRTFVREEGHHAF